MGEPISPDLTLPLKREWFAAIWNGEKTVEYREVKPFWIKRIGEWSNDWRGKFIMFQMGYLANGPRMLVQVTGFDVGPCPYAGWDGEYYRIKFEVVQHYMKQDGIFFPMIEVPKMKPKKGTKK